MYLDVIQFLSFIAQFFNGTFNSINHKLGVEGLRSRMEKFFKRVREKGGREREREKERERERERGEIRYTDDDLFSL